MTLPEDRRGAADTVRSDIGSRDDVEQLVRRFYRQAAMDELLGPVFEAAAVRWDQHIETLTDFWSWQLLGHRVYDGNPLRAHEPVHRRTPFTAAHYERWLDLFVDTVDELFAGDLAEAAKVRARKMAAALERLMRGVNADGGVAIDVLRVAPR